LPCTRRRWAPNLPISIRKDKGKKTLLGENSPSQLSKCTGAGVTCAKALLDPVGGPLSIIDERKKDYANKVTPVCMN